MIRRCTAFFLIRAFFVVVGLSLALLPVESAFAHGGRFVAPAPPPPPPPMYRPPSVRHPGRPGVPSTRGPVTPGRSGAPSTPVGPPQGPVTPGRGGRLPTTGARGPNRGQTPPPVDPGTDWGTWWALNRWAYLPDRHTVLTRRLGVVTPSSSEDERGTPDEPEIPEKLDGWEVRRATLARGVVVPRLLGMLAPKADVPTDVRAAALIALARTAHDEASIDVVLAYARDRDAAPDVREAAALAIGLFRRTDPEARFSGVRLDLLRRSLVQLVDDRLVPKRTRAMAALSLGILADQPYGTAATRDGKLVTHELWERLSAKHADVELPVALLTALGHQPTAGVPENVREGLQQIVMGKRVHGLIWSAWVRAHALTARLRLRGAGFDMLLVRALTASRAPRPVRRAAFIGLSQVAPDLDAGERGVALDAWWKTIRKLKDPFTGGLAYVAVGRLLGADLAADAEAPLLTSKRGLAALLKEARRARTHSGGFVVLGIGLALREADEGSADVRRLRVEAQRLFTQGLKSKRISPKIRGAYAVGLGLLRCRAATSALAKLTADPKADPDVRRHAALALAQIGSETADVRPALMVAVSQSRSNPLREDAALALALLGSSDDVAGPLEELGRSGSHQAVGQLALALGRLGNLRAVVPLLVIASTAKHSTENRAIAVASMGLLLDPERRPSLSKLQIDANYPVRTPALHEVFDIL